MGAASSVLSHGSIFKSDWELGMGTAVLRERARQDIKYMDADKNNQPPKYSYIFSTSARGRSERLRARGSEGRKTNVPRINPNFWYGEIRRLRQYREI